MIASGWVFISNDNGINWKKANDISLKSTNTTIIPNNMNSVEALTISNDNIYAGTWDGRIFLSKDNGENWLQIANLRTTFYCLAVKENTIFAGTGAGTGICRKGICSSTDNGENWTKCKSLPPQFVESFAINGSDIYAGTTQGVFMSSDNGNTWTTAGNLDGYVIGSIVINGNYILAGTCNEGFNNPDNFVYLSKNKGSSWSKVKRGLPSVSGFSLKIESLFIKGNTVFVGFDLISSDGNVGGGGIYKNETIIGK